MSELSKDFEDCKKNITKYIIEQKQKSFKEGAYAVIDILKGAAHEAGTDYIMPEWLDTAREQIKQFPGPEP